MTGHHPGTSSGIICGKGLVLLKMFWSFWRFVALGMCLLGQSCCQDNSKYQKQYSYTYYYEHQFLQGKERKVKTEILCQSCLNIFRATVILTPRLIVGIFFLRSNHCCDFLLFPVSNIHVTMVTRQSHLCNISLFSFTE